MIAIHQAYRGSVIQRSSVEYRKLLSNPTFPLIAQGTRDQRFSKGNEKENKSNLEKWEEKEDLQSGYLAGMEDTAVLLISVKPVWRTSTIRRKERKKERKESTLAGMETEAQGGARKPFLRLLGPLQRLCFRLCRIATLFHSQNGGARGADTRARKERRSDSLKTRNGSRCPDESNSLFNLQSCCQFVVEALAFTEETVPLDLSGSSVHLLLPFISSFRKETQWTGSKFQRSS